MAGQRFLVPYVRVRLLPPQPFLAWSSSGLGRRPLKAEIGGSNPLQATTIVTGQAIAWPVLFSGQVAGIRTDEVEFRQEHHPPSVLPISFIDSPLGLFSTKTFPHFDCVGPFRFRSLFTRFH